MLAAPTFLYLQTGAGGAAVILYQDFLLPCCGGWHVEHLRVRIGSYHHWLLKRLEDLQ